MSYIFLSASVPVKGRGNYYKTAKPFLIQFAVREFVKCVIRDYDIVWGGHPAITPMVESICEDMNVKTEKFHLYQSEYFKDNFPDENYKFQNINYVTKVNNSREDSLERMRNEMLCSQHFKAAVFIGGMNGVHDEYRIFRKYNPEAKILPIGATGGASAELAKNCDTIVESDVWSINFSKIFYTELIN